MEIDTALEDLVPQFDISTRINRALKGDSVESPKNLSSTRLKLKKIPTGQAVYGIVRGQYKNYIKIGDFVIIVERKIRRFYEIIEVNARTLLIEKERVSNDGNVVRYYCKIKNIIGIISTG
jgi:hypothetical protein